MTISNKNGMLRCKLTKESVLKAIKELKQDEETVRNAIKDYTKCPASYGIDFGLTDDGRTLLVEVNDGFALGNYGLDELQYARLFMTRWKQLWNS